MKGIALAFLLIGAGAGFAAIYPWMHRRAPEIAVPLPQLKPSSAAASDAGQGSPEAAPPPLDTARLKELEDAVTANPKNLAALTELGNMQADQMNFDEAAKWYKQAVAVDPKNIEMRNYLGEALFQGKHIEESLATFKSTLDINPTHPEALFDYGFVLLQGKNDPQGAIQSWEKLVKTNPNFDGLDRVKQMIAMVQERTK